MPWPQPWPVQLPEPIAIFDWMMFQPVPSGSDSGSRKVRMRSFWYGRSSQNHATGAAAATPANAAANHHHDSPARYSANAPLDATSIAVPTVLILLQPDFGTAMLIAASGVFALLLAGLPWWWVGVAVGGVAAVAPVAWIWLLRPYQKDRILTFLEPERDPLGTGWNIIQSKIAIGSGGLTGKGWGEGSQAHLNFIPEQTTDFVFAVLSEEFGWVGVATVLALYLFVVGRCLWIAMEARDTYSRLLAGSLGLAFFVYVLVNGGMVSGLLPVVGVPMPLISYGGTAAVSLLAGFGLVMAARVHRPVHGG